MGITASCKFCQLPFEIINEDLAFYERIAVPPPTLCPEDRQRRRASFRNERNLYTRTCDGTGQRIVSMYSPVSPFTVYEPTYYRGDSWNGLDYGRPIDFERPFFEQFRELQLKVPRAALFRDQSENCDYTTHSWANKNCYMCALLQL